jgi:hypothetical protein
VKGLCVASKAQKKPHRSLSRQFFAGWQSAKGVKYVKQFCLNVAFHGRSDSISLPPGRCNQHPKSVRKNKPGKADLYFLHNRGPSTA